MRQSSHLRKAVPAGLTVLLPLFVVFAPGLAEGQQYRVASNGNFRRDPDPRGALLAFVENGAVLDATGQEGAWQELTLEGWIWARSVQPDNREGHNLSVTPGVENLRDAPNGSVVARVRQGTLLDEIERRSGWVHVRRSGWMYAPSLERVTTARAPTSQPAQPERTSPTSAAASAASPSSAAPSLDHATTRDRTLLRRVPEGAPTATLSEDTPVRILARSGDWVRVQTEGWVRQDELKPAQPGVLMGVSAAELRAKPDDFKGKVLQWQLQFIAVQPPDEVRPDLPEGRSWILARGPQPEQGYVYLVVTDDQLAWFRSLDPLAELVVLGRVRTARSRYLQVPVLDVIEVRKR